MLEYQRLLRVRGASKMVRLIKDHTSFDLDRKTLENWLNERGIEPSYITLKAITRFLATPYFAKAVPRVRDYFEADSRLCRIGTALFDLYGGVGGDADKLIKLNFAIGGWWVAERVFTGNSTGQSFLRITPVADQPFSKIHVLIRSDEVPIGSGIVFPKNDNWPEYLARIYSKELYFREKLLLLEVRRENYDRLTVTFTPRSDPVEFPGRSFINVHFSRVTENSVSAEIKNTFDDWDHAILPRDLGRLAFFGDGHRNAIAGVPESQIAAFEVVRRMDKALEDNYDPTED